MGYDRGAYALGYIDDLRDPIEAVRPGIGSTGFGATPGTGRRPSSGGRLQPLCDQSRRSRRTATVVPCR